MVSGGKVSLARDYAPYGEELARSGAGTSEYGYAGEWTDSSGLQYLRARYYDPSVGRFVSRDSYNGNPYFPILFNRWLFVGGNPVNFSDPTGLFPCHDNLLDNNCEIGDLVSWMFRDIFQANQIDPDLSINIGKGGQLNVAGNVTYEYMKPFKPLGETFYEIAKFGSGSIFGPIDPLSTAELISGYRLFGEPLSEEERLESSFWLILGLGECGSNLKFISKTQIDINSNPLSGQKHHVITNKILSALKIHPTLKGIFSRDDYVLVARELLDHKGYQSWHIAYDKEVLDWLASHNSATKEEFLLFLREIYSRPDILIKFPTALSNLP